MSKRESVVIDGKTGAVVGVVGVVSLFATNMANAALDPAVTSAITTGGADAATVGGLILALVIGIAIFCHMRAAK